MDRYFKILNVIEIIFSLILITILDSCAKTRLDEYHNNAFKVRFAGYRSDASTKTQNSGLTTTWIANTDKIGIFSPQSRNTPTGIDGVSNAEFTAMQSGQLASFSGEMYWGDSPSTFYAYYPYAAGGINYSQVPVTFKAIQNQLTGNDYSHINSLDFLISDPVTNEAPGKSGTEGSVYLSFNHLFTLLEFQIINTTANVSIKKITLKGGYPLQYSSGKIDISQPTPADGSQYILKECTTPSYTATLSLINAYTTTNNYSTTPKSYMIILPGENTSELRIQLSIDGVNKEVRKPAVNFLRGRKYVIKIDAKDAVTPKFTMDDLKEVTVGNIVWSPRNAGYDVNHKYGLMYQWGRKFGQGFNLTEQPNKLVISSASTTMEMVNQEPNSANFYKLESGFNGYATAETTWPEIYSPCPTGWRLPTSTDFENLKAYGFTAQLSGGPDEIQGIWVGPNNANSSLREFSAVFFPLNGYNDLANGAGTARTQSGHYWTSGKLKYYFTNATNLTLFNATGEYYLHGKGVRCVKDKL